MCAGGFKSWSTWNLPVSNSRDLANLIDLLGFCVTEVLVYSVDMIHGKVGAIDPVRLNGKQESYLWGDKVVTNLRRFLASNLQCSGCDIV